MKFMKSVPADRKAHGGFEWPAEVGAIVEAPDWSPEPVCGGGLHGLIDGRGDVDLLCKDADAVWYAFESVDEHGNPSDADAIAIDDAKGKCRRAVVRAVGERATVTRWMIDAGCIGVHFGTATAGDGGTATAGNRGTATAGNRGTATAGNRGTATAGNRGTATAGYRGTATAGDGGTATAGDCGTATAGYDGTATAGYDGTATAGYGGTATAGDYGTATAGAGGTATAGDGGTATAGDNGTATAGDRGTATAGDCGTATAGNRGTATAGYDGTATAGDGGVLAIYWWNGKRRKIACAEVGENGIEPNVAYRLDEDGNFVKA